VRYAVLSDIHANLEALQAVLADAEPRSDATVCLGDLVGYGADPVACIEIVAQRAQAIVSGNHEHAVAGLIDLDWFNVHARAAAEWTRARLDDDHRRYLSSLPLVAEVGDATLVHASPDRPDEWEYLLTAQDGFDAFGAFATRLCFVGHSHLAGAWSLGSSGPEHRVGARAPGRERGRRDLRKGGPEHRVGAHDRELERGRRYLVNVGSVGQPRDRDPRAAYAIWDDERGTISIRRVVYDVERAREKILRGGLPRFLADRLAWGS
jgi:diadenosine tetraphosphatase ApaH/serine/threonine PP2A family protein phosphatase